MAVFQVRPRDIRSPFRWDPWREIEDIRRVLDHVGSLDGAPGGVEPDAVAFVPRADISDAETAFLIRVDLPGIREADLDIAIEGGALAIRGRREPAGSKEEGVVVRERPSGRFERVIKLPQPADVARAKAILSRGVLEITVPKSRSAAPQKVAVSVAEGDESGYLRVSK